MITKQEKAAYWFEKLQDNIINKCLSIEKDFSDCKPIVSTKKWDRNGGGGGKYIRIYGKVFEKIGVNFSRVHGKLDDIFAGEIPGALSNECNFWASGISVVAHMCSPFVPAIHMNTRFICTSQSWFGGGIDLTPTYYNKEDELFFHEALRKVCDNFDLEYYPKFKKQCDDYFFLHHREESRGIGGIFYDYLNSGNWDHDFTYTQEVGKCFLEVYPVIVRKNMYKKWTTAEREFQLIKRGRYVEFNLLYDRGTRFGIMTHGNPDAIMMSMPPLVKWE
ncbi:oxygen-dependent coproporphyrinogen oxidase [Candidatus Neoehrlichia procyonis]|uniref:coproporphyrinogen oxidase n=1 Tax=Candidatus Neoehrlichia procyonis str. RAC413 TaxID=1359163 RepID=A0A0F3NMC7_9RICK|nr:oxygen-dependent coproporphyrinogen oxidase [Candidatus Neoehrlichia lotoris]KJV68936.1 coproporphyrinogen III oxidase family protein [Candidatus Neoehrlichia lotoris str. RAC413]